MCDERLHGNKCSSSLNFFMYLATDVVTVYVFQEPSLLSSLQDNGLTDVVLQALLVKDVSIFLFKSLELLPIS